MFIEREVRRELNALSKEVFGASGRWMKLLAKGQSELVTKKVTEEVPGENGQPATTREFTVAALNEHGQKIFRQKYYTVDDVRNLMLDLRKQRDEALANAKAKRERQQLEQEIQNMAAGGTPA